jgi:aminotransferase
MLLLRAQETKLKMLSLSERSDCVMQSEIRNMSLECERLGGLNLSQGVCDTEVPLPVRRAARAAIDEGYNTYTHHIGIAQLRDALCRKIRLYSGMDVDPESELVVTAGSTGAFYSACMALLNPGDEVILFEPFYGYHLSTITATGLSARFVTMKPPEWTFTEQDLELATGPRTRAIMVCTPNNPTGKVFSRAELEMTARFAERHELFVFTDEIYEHFVYGGQNHVCPATLPGMKKRTIAISGLSKTFSITGWRIGYSVSDETWSNSIGYFSDLIYVCAPAPLQMGVARGLEHLPPEYFNSLAAQYVVKRDRICDALSEAGLTPFVPQGAYYVLADIGALPGRSAKERAMFLLEQTGVACVPGDAFFHDGKGQNLARFCFAKEDSVLEEACLRLSRFKPLGTGQY